MFKKSGHFWLDFFACFLIPAYTLLFAGSVEWFGTNFSVIAVTGPDHYRGFIYWGILSGGYFFVMLIRLSAAAGPVCHPVPGLRPGYSLSPPVFPKVRRPPCDSRCRSQRPADAGPSAYRLDFPPPGPGPLGSPPPLLPLHGNRLRHSLPHPQNGVHCVGGLFHHLRRPAGQMDLAAPRILTILLSFSYGIFNPWGV